MKIPKVSIIIPNYNHERFLKQRLDSVFNQTYQDFEVILLDDCSTDQSRVLLSKYAKHNKVSHCVFNTINSGSTFKQWEKGIELAKGDYVWIAESDDFCDEIFLEKLIQVMEKKTIVLAYSATLHIDEINNKKYKDEWASVLDEKRWEANYFNIGSKEVKKYFKYRNIIPNASAVLFKKNIIKKIELPIKMKYCGDWHTWLKLLEFGDIAYVSTPLNFYRKHLATTRVFKLLKDERERFSEYFQIINSHSSFWNRLKNIKKYEWILLECFLKRRTLGRFPNIKLRLPIEFQIGYLLFLIKLKNE